MNWGAKVPERKDLVRVPTRWRQYDIIRLIQLVSRSYGVNECLALRIAYHESEFNPYAEGDDGKAVGLWQWHLPSWHHVRDKMGRPLDDERSQPWASTDTAMYAMGVLGLWQWWSTLEMAYLDCMNTTP